MPKPTKILAPKRYIKTKSHPMDFMIGIDKDGSRFIYIEGDFEENTYEDFLKFVKKLPKEIREVKINSNGGVLNSAIKIGSYVYENHYNTGVDTQMQCYSACSFAFFAGRKKSLQDNGKVGLHRPYFPNIPDTPQLIRKIKREYISYWNYIKAPKCVYDEMMNTDRDELFLLDKNNIYEYVEKIIIKDEK